MIADHVVVPKAWLGKGINSNIAGINTNVFGIGADVDSCTHTNKPCMSFKSINYFSKIAVLKTSMFAKIASFTALLAVFDSFISRLRAAAYVSVIMFVIGRVCSHK